MAELRDELAQVRQLASTDALSGLSNRAAFFEVLDNLLTAGDTDENPFCLAMMDIDHFKRINDTFGHLVGDKVIRFVADTLKQSIKGQDTAGRYGGEEFLVVAPGTGLYDAAILAERLRRVIETDRIS